MTAVRYITPLSAIASPVWVPLSPARLITTEPLRSSDGVATYARMGYRDALAAAAEMGAALPTREDIIALHGLARGVGTELRPVTFPDVELCALNGVMWHDEAGKQRLREQHMMSAAWAAFHDNEVVALIDQAMVRRGVPSAGPWANIGKHWIAGASPGRARLMGWWTGTAWIQDGEYPPGYTQERHDDAYCDYSSTVVLVRAA